MPIKFHCTSCDRWLGVPERLAGKSGKCPGCGGVIHVPAGNPPGPRPPTQDATDYNFRVTDTDAETESGATTDPTGPWFVSSQGKVRGPLTWEALGAMAADGRITSDSKVSQDRVSWQSASAVPGLLPEPEPPLDAQGRGLHDAESARHGAPSHAGRPGCPPLDGTTKLMVAAGAVGLLLLGISPFFRWVSSPYGGTRGISGDGKIVLGLTVASIVAFVVRKLHGTVFTLLWIQSWGTVALFWMTGLIWRLESLVSSTELRDNPFAAMFAGMISPGAGLYLGAVGGITAAGASGFLVVRLLRARKSLRPYAVTQGVSCLIGVLLFVLVTRDESEKALPDSSQKPDFRYTGTPKSLATPAVQSERALALGQASAFGGVEVTPLTVELRTVSGWRKSFGEERTAVLSKEPLLVLTLRIRNVSQGAVFSPVTEKTLRASHITDNFNNVMQAVVKGAFEMDDFEFDGQTLGDLKPGQSMTTLILCERPKVENANSFRWQVYVVSGNDVYFNEFSPPEDSAIIVNFTRSDIRVR